ncbi:MAG TPA: hypothetical protein VL484_17435 [Vicinamibacterales bacterium]|nr:hypothetical protein [Vicinamibacterales bacterium]
MSLLERLGGGHLDDRTFVHLWADGLDHPHLSACAACRKRFETYHAWIEGISDELRVEADRAFTTERLAAQQAQIARRLEALDRPTRVIPFPRSPRVVIGNQSPMRRWMVAAAAGLIAGVGLAQVVDRSFDRHDPAQLSHFSVSDASQRANAIRPASFKEGDEEFLDGAEALGPRVKELRALDDLTPHMRDLETRK